MSQQQYLLVGTNCDILNIQKDNITYYLSGKVLSDISEISIKSPCGWGNFFDAK